MPQSKDQGLSRFHSIEDISVVQGNPNNQKSQRATGVCGAAPMMVDDTTKKDKYLSQDSAVPVIQIGDAYVDQPPNKPNLPLKDATRLYNISSASDDDRQIEKQV